MNSPDADGHSPVGFPHSEISGSKPVSGSPELIAAIHVLRRLWLPRHPPYALCSLALSLRHASSRARDSTSESRHFPFRVATLGRYDLETLRWECLGFQCYLVFNEQWRDELALAIRTVAHARICCGGADRDRTDDLRLAKPALSRLSYSPRPAWSITCGPGQT